MRPLDTHPESHRIEIEGFRRMSPGQRGAMVVELTMEVRKVAEHGVRRRHPDYDDETVGRALFRLFYGDELYRRVFPGEPLVTR